VGVDEGNTVGTGAVVVGLEEGSVDGKRDKPLKPIGVVQEKL
jgi:hypothetical protein